MRCPYAVDYVPKRVIQHVARLFLGRCFPPLPQQELHCQNNVAVGPHRLGKLQISVELHCCIFQPVPELGELPSQAFSETCASTVQLRRYEEIQSGLHMLQRLTGLVLRQGDHVADHRRIARRE